MGFEHSVLLKVGHGGALLTLVAGRRALLTLVVESTLLALAGREKDDPKGCRSPDAPALACESAQRHRPAQVTELQYQA